MAHWKDTPSHGYLYPTARENANVPEQWRMNRYEEDCDWAILPAFNPHLYGRLKLYTNGRLMTAEEEKAVTMETLIAWHPDVYERVTGETVTIDMSRTQARRDYMTKYNGHLAVHESYSLVINKDRDGLVALSESQAKQETGEIVVRAHTVGMAQNFFYGMNWRDESPLYFRVKARDIDWSGHGADHMAPPLLPKNRTHVDKMGRAYNPLLR